MSDGYAVYTGLWTNWRDGTRVLTVTQRDGAILIATLALVTSVSMGQLWSILRFATHQIRSTSSPRSGLYHQQQAVLRGDSSSASVLASLVSIAWAWKSKHIGAVRQSSPLIALAALHLGLLAVSSILSSRVAITGDEVLLREGVCGWANGSTTEGFDALDSATATFLVGRELALQSRQYARSCYNSSSGIQVDSGACKGFSAPNIPFTTAKVPCPFSKDICALPDATQIDTGYIDSDEHLGINTGPESRVRMRRLFTCSPLLAEERFSSDWTASYMDTRMLPNDSYRYYDLGPTLNRSYTYAVRNYSYWTANGRTAYILGARGALPGTPDMALLGFWPIPELQVDKSDVTLLFLENMARYLAPVEDPFFRASSLVHQTGAKALGDPGVFIWYPDQAVSVLGCAEQYQFCNTTACSPFGERPDDAADNNRTLALADAFFPGIQQRAIFYIFLKALWYTYLPQAILMTGSNVLLAQDSVIAGGTSASVGLPADQWRSEVVHFAAVALAALQRVPVLFAAPPAVPVNTLRNGSVPASAFARPAAADRGGSLCGSVRVLDPRFASFSVAGVATLLALGATVTLANALCVPGAVFALRRRLRLGGRFAERAWREGGLLRLQRTAFDAHGVRPWEVDGEGDVPTTMDERLGRRTASWQAIKAGGNPRDGMSTTPVGSVKPLKAMDCVEFMLQHSFKYQGRLW